jgi:hypothetical protein
MPDKCPICKQLTMDEKNVSADFFTFRVKCKMCGSFDISSPVVSSEQYNDEPYYLVSSYIRRKTEFEKGTYQIVTDLKSLEKSIQKPNLNEQIDMILDYVSKSQKHAADYILLQPLNEYPIFYCKNSQEFVFLLSKSSELEYFEFNPDSKITEKHLRNSGMTEIISLRLNIKGIQRLYELQKKNVDSLKCFVAMSFANKYDFVFDDGISPIFIEDETIKKSGISAYRVDKDFTNLSDQTIVNKIIAQIKSSRFVIGDFTGNNRNVYFEVGYAMGMQIPVILICHTKYTKRIRFDLKQHPFFFYDTIDNLKDQLKAAIKANIKL